MFIVGKNIGKYSRALSCNNFGKQFGNILKFKLQVPFNLAIPFLGLYPKDIVTSAQHDYGSAQHVCNIEKSETT